MNYKQQFDIAEELLVKQALMDKVIDSVKQYRPFNTGDALGATGTTSAVGAGLGALLGGGSAAIQGAFTKDKDEEGRKNKKPSILRRALIGAGIGGLGGAALPQVGMALKPYLNESAGDIAATEALTRFDEKWPTYDTPTDETSSVDAMKFLLQNQMRNKTIDVSSFAGRTAANENLPKMTISDIIEQVRAAKERKAATPQ